MGHQMGYTRIENKFIDEIMATVAPSAVAVYLVILRHTAGWSKETDTISLSQFSRYTGMTRNTVAKSIQQLLDHHLITRAHLVINGSDAYAYGIANVEHITIASPTMPDPVPHTSDIPSANFDIPSAIIDTPSANFELGSAKNELVTTSNFDTPSANFEHPPVQNLSIQKKDIKKHITKERDTGTGASTEPVSPPDQSAKRDERLDTWQIKCYRELARLTPPHAARGDIINTVTDEPAWREAITTWIGKGYRPQNIVGLLDFYRQRYSAERAQANGLPRFTTKHRELVNGKWQEVSIDEYLRRNETFND